MKPALFCVLLLQAAAPAMGYAEGAPSEVCESMKPGHQGVSPQAITSPYTIKTSNSTFKTGQNVTVIIDGEGYGGVLLQARSGSSTKSLGTWGTPPSNTKHLECSGNKQGAITHSNINMKNNLTVYTWMPPSTTDSFYFIATVAKEKSIYWLTVKSKALTREAGSGADPQKISSPLLLCVLFLSTLASVMFQS
ncbi:putative defense protein 3 [Hoplias malabaricus]|uniref:putative defense protein 3 n=1 Tax=Hoplias malabaricus TaxID=27720 RepID=UPI003461FC6E